MSAIVQDYAEQLEIMQELYTYVGIDDVPTDDSILTIIGKKFHDENMISNYLAYVFDPEVNGVGYQALARFLEIIKSPLEVFEADEIKVHREYHLNNNRRIDFLITINNENIIAIEHKVYSEEHGDQTLDYEREILKEFGEKAENVVLIFLTPKSKPALNPNFIPVGYHQLVSALKQVNVNFMADIRKAVLFNEMIFHLEGYFLEDKKIAISDKTSLYIRHQKMIRDLQKQFERNYHNIFLHIQSVIKSKFPDDSGGGWQVDFKEGRHYHQIYKPHWKSGGLNIHFEIQLKEESLFSGEIEFLLDIEAIKRSKEKEAFLAGHEQQLKQLLAPIMEKNDILYRKGKRADTFAGKTYRILTEDILKNEEVFKNHLVAMIEDFKDFIDVVDGEIERFRRSEYI